MTIFIDKYLGGTLRKPRLLFGNLTKLCSFLETKPSDIPKVTVIRKNDFRG